MTADGASGLLALTKFGFFAALVSIVAVVVGFSVVPLTQGKELLDATRRLAAGLLSSFTLGPILASQVIASSPNYVDTWGKVLGADPGAPVAFIAAATPFIALSGIVGFWVVAAFMRFFTRRAKKDALQIAQELIQAEGGRRVD